MGLNIFVVWERANPLAISPGFNFGMLAKFEYFEISPLSVTARYQQLQSEYLEIASTVQEQKQLIAQLEEDLRNVNALSSMFRGEGEGVESISQEAEMVAEAVKDISTGTLLDPSQNN